MMLSRPYLVAAIACIACGKEPISSPLPPPPQPPQWEGRYTGQWQIAVNDTSLDSVFDFLHGRWMWIHRSLGEAHCDLTVDITMPTASTYSAEFTIDTAHACSNYPTNPLLSYLRLPTSGKLNGVFGVDTGSAPSAVVMTVGDGSWASVEALFGCRTLDTGSGWRFHVWSIRTRQESRSGMVGDFVDRNPHWSPVYECQGRSVFLDNIGFWADRP